MINLHDREEICLCSHVVLKGYECKWCGAAPLDRELVYATKGKPKGKGDDMKQLTKDQLAQRDTKERVELWDLYGQEIRCLGGHLMHSSHRCHRCGARWLNDVCHEEKLATQYYIKMQDDEIPISNRERALGYEEVKHPSSVLYAKTI